MKEVLFNDPNFKNSETYKDYMSQNPAYGFLSIRAYAANKALPISNLKVEVSKILDGNKVIFFSGQTDESGLIEKISLPTPLVSSDDEIIPASQNYDIKAIYEDQNLIFTIVMYANISVNQNINVVPLIRLDGSFYGR